MNLVLIILINNIGHIMITSQCDYGILDFHLMYPVAIAKRVGYAIYFT